MFQKLFLTLVFLSCITLAACGKNGVEEGADAAGEAVPQAGGEAAGEDRGPVIGGMDMAPAGGEAAGGMNEPPAGAGGAAGGMDMAPAGGEAVGGMDVAPAGGAAGGMDVAPAGGEAGGMDMAPAGGEAAGGMNMQEPELVCNPEAACLLEQCRQTASTLCQNNPECIRARCDCLCESPDVFCGCEEEVGQLQCDLEGAPMVCSDEGEPVEGYACQEENFCGALSCFLEMQEPCTQVYDDDDGFLVYLCQKGSCDCLCDEFDATCGCDDPRFEYDDEFSADLEQCDAQAPVLGCDAERQVVPIDEVPICRPEQACELAKCYFNLPFECQNNPDCYRYYCGADDCICNDVDGVCGCGYNFDYLNSGLCGQVLQHPDPPVCRDAQVDPFTPECNFEGLCDLARCFQSEEVQNICGALPQEEQTACQFEQCACSCVDLASGESLCGCTDENYWMGRDPNDVIFAECDFDIPAMLCEDGWYENNQLLPRRQPNGDDDPEPNGGDDDPPVE